MEIATRGKTVDILKKKDIDDGKWFGQANGNGCNAMSPCGFHCHDTRQHVITTHVNRIKETMIESVGL
ncbi:Uncharacterized protein TCM_036866 [Theobroma cacao]|uniref:Uncharacterized protein n=1 Tax=Theobroma cacao TaxID=3641 RepID=A0A061GIC1_THECC|nr:Uncharacterized protein TCM_036866 [Theobroma cacao]